MNRLLLRSFLLGIACAAVSGASAQNSIIISQYVETNSGTIPKGVELWNVSGGAIDFGVTPLVVSKGTNGGPLAPDVTVDSGTLASGAVMVIGTTDMGEYLTSRGLSGVLYVNEGFTFNGDDALQVTLDGNVEDTFGNPGSDPGSAWTGGGVSTQNSNIALLPSITTGDVDGFTDPSERFGTVSENPAGECGLIGFGLAPDGDAAACQTVFDGEGWRLLSAPVSGLTVGDLAGINLVQGIDAGATNGAQYPSADANLLTEYTGGGMATSYNAPTDTDEILSPGRGFWWYWYDEDAGPFAGGTSQGYELSSFVLTASGPAETADVTQAFTNNADDFYMIGNPFPVQLNLVSTTGPAAITTSAGTLQSSLYLWDPETSAYVTRAFTQEFPPSLAPWQGAFAQITGTSGADPTVTYESDYATGECQNIPSECEFVGRVAAEPGLALRLDGMLASGTAVADRAANLRILDDAEIGWDRHDLSELASPNAEVAMLALVGERDGEPRRQGILSLPTALDGSRTIPVAFLASGSGTFEVSWDAAVLPSGWTATLRDRVAASESDLASEGTYAFDAEATDWADRFEILVSANAVATEAVADAEAWVGDVHPNPTAGASRLGVRLGEAQRITATVFDAVGRQVAVAYDGALAAGTQRVDLETASLAPGVYVVRIAGETFTESRRLVVTR